MRRILDAQRAALGASLIPLTLGLDAIRQIVLASGRASGFMRVPTECVILAVLGVAFVSLAYFLLAYMERLAIREGKLTESRG